MTDQELKDLIEAWFSNYDLLYNWTELEQYPEIEDEFKE